MYVLNFIFYTLNTVWVNNEYQQSVKESVPKYLDWI